MRTILGIALVTAVAMGTGCKSKPSPSGTAVASTSVPSGPTPPPAPPPERKVEVTLCKSVKDGLAQEPTDHFPTGTAPVFAVWRANWLKPGQAVTGRWFQEGERPGERAVQVMEKSAVYEGTTGPAHGELSLGPPPEGWPKGAYHLDVLVDGEKVASAPFRID